MSWPLALLLLSSAPIVVHVEELGELEQDRALAVAASVGRALQARTSSSARIEDPAWWGCPEQSQARCAEEAASRAGARDVVMLRMFSSVRAIRVLAARVSVGGAGPPLSASVDLTRSSSSSAAALELLAARLFPEATTRPGLASAGIASVPNPSSGPGPWPWVALGVGVASSGVASALLASSLGARADLEAQIRSHTEYEALSSRADTHGALATGLFIAGGAAVVTGLVLLWLGD